jgi:nucleotide-binding universal stress UspA family protein
MYNKILVPLDGSKLAECALSHAESLALAYKSTLFLLSAISIPPLSQRMPLDMELIQHTLEAGRNQMQNYLKNLQDEFAEKNIKTEIHIGIEPVVGEIIDAAEKHSVDLVVIASHGRSGLGRFFYGSVASGVLNRIERPLLIIHP